MPQLRQRLLLNGIAVHYKGAPTVNVSVDGALSFTFTAPNHTTYRTRFFTAPAGVYGFIFDATSNSVDMLEYEFATASPSAFSEQTIWHYYEVTYRGTVNISLFLDEEERVGQSQSSTYDIVTLSTTKGQETEKIYMPPMSYGRVPHVTNTASDSGEIYNFNPVRLPARFYSDVRSVSEARITYKGQVNVCLYMDGNKIGNEHSFEGKTSEYGADIYSTEVFYVDAGTVGRVFQWEQISGNGDIISVETDAHPLEMEPANVPEPR